MTAADREKSLERVIVRYHDSGDALIEVLHSAQQIYGYLSRPVLRKIARRLKLPPSLVLGVATFYHLFRFAPPREHSAVVCMGTACYAAGAPQLMKHLRRRCGENWTLEEARCVGSCGLAPVVNCDGEAWSRVTVPQIDSQLGKKA